MDELAFVIIEEEDFGWRVKVILPDQMKSCKHNWEINKKIEDLNLTLCNYCKIQTNERMRGHCIICLLTVCPMCSRFYEKMKIEPLPPRAREFNSRESLIKELKGYNLYLIGENDRLQRALDADLLKEARELEEHDKASTSQEVVLRMQEGNKTKKVLNRLYNLLITFNIPGTEKFTIRAILDTGATSCCINEGSVPASATEEAAMEATFHGINSTQATKRRLKNGQMEIEGNNFRIPFTYVFPMEIKDGIEMLIGCNFIRAMQGGLRIEGNSVTFYKNITMINTSREVEVAGKAIPELDMDEEEFIATNEFICYTKGAMTERFEQRFKSTMEELKEQGYIGENPMLHWKKNKGECKLEIINPDITIQDKPLKHATPLINEQFKRH